MLVFDELSSSAILSHQLKLTQTEDRLQQETAFCFEWNLALCHWQICKDLKGAQEHYS